jgi:hypothetical protein
VIKLDHPRINCGLVEEAAPQLRNQRFTTDS